MLTPNEFWLALHMLAEAYDAEGLTPDERSANIMEQLRRMPPTVRRQVLGDLQRLATHLEDIFVTARVVAMEEDARLRPPQRGKAS